MTAKVVICLAANKLVGYGIYYQIIEVFLNINRYCICNYQKSYLIDVLTIQIKVHFSGTEMISYNYLPIK